MPSPQIGYGSIRSRAFAIRAIAAWLSFSRSPYAVKIRADAPEMIRFALLELELAHELAPAVRAVGVGFPRLVEPRLALGEQMAACCIRLERRRVGARRTRVNEMARTRTQARGVHVVVDA